MSMSTDCVLAIDVGGTKTALALVNRRGKYIARDTIKTRVADDDVHRVAHAAQLWVAEQVNHRVSPTPRAIAAGFPEYVDASGCLTSREVLNWSRQPADVLADAFSRVLPALAPVLVDSDVRLGAVGEAVWGAGRGTKAFIYASLGTGLSTTFVLEGVAWPGSRGEAIAFGEWPVPGRPTESDDEPMNLETYVSGAGMATRFRRSTGESIDALELTRRALQGDNIAMSIQLSAGRALGVSLAALVAVLDPDRVVLGGGLGTSQAPVIEATRQAYLEVVAARRSPPPLTTATTGADAGLLGAAASAWRALDNPWTP